jgi:hypothetical protein
MHVNRIRYCTNFPLASIKEFRSAGSLPFNGEDTKSVSEHSRLILNAFDAAANTEN